jgi:glutamate-1-semialdehyde 2,1-aminomutase
VSPTDPCNPNFVYDDVDAKVWREELDPFLPERLFDVHGHVYLKGHRPSAEDEKPDPSMPRVVDEYPHEVFASVHRTLFPGREVRALVFGSVDAKVDLDSTNAYVRDAARTHGWDALMVPSLGDDAETLLAKVREGGFLGFKPYWTFAAEKRGIPQNDVTLEDMIPAGVREAADRGGLIIMTHIPRAGRLADPVNISGLRKLCADAPRAKIVLAHFGRSYFPEAVGDGLILADLDNLYPELSFVQDWEVVEMVLGAFDRRKVLFGLDLPTAQEKGKMIGINGQRHFFTKRPHAWSAHVEPGAYEVRCTLFAYEVCRAIRKAAERLKLSRDEVEDVFCRNAERLVDAAKDSRNSKLETRK